MQLHRRDNKYIYTVEGFYSVSVIQNNLLSDMKLPRLFSTYHILSQVQFLEDDFPLLQRYAKVGFMLVPQTIFIILTRGAPSANRQSQSPQVRCSRPAQPLDASSDISCAQVTWPHHANHKCIFQVVSSKHVFEIQ